MRHPYIEHGVNYHTVLCCIKQLIFYCYFKLFDVSYGIKSLEYLNLRSCLDMKGHVRAWCCDPYF